MKRKHRGEAEAEGCFAGGGGAVGGWLLEGHAFASEGRRTFVGLTVHGRTKGRLESHLQSSPAVGVTVTEADVNLRGDIVAPAHCGRG